MCTKNHNSPKTITDAAKVISTKPDRENAPFAIRHNLDPDSNLAEETDSRLAQYSSAKTSTKARKIH
jgi:hypothetical protein